MHVPSGVRVIAVYYGNGSAAMAYGVMLGVRTEPPDRTREAAATASPKPALRRSTTPHSTSTGDHVVHVPGRALRPGHLHAE